MLNSLDLGTLLDLLKTLGVEVNIDLRVLPYILDDENIQRLRSLLVSLIAEWPTVLQYSPDKVEVWPRGISFYFNKRNLILEAQLWGDDLYVLYKFPPEVYVKQITDNIIEKAIRNTELPENIDRERVRSALRKLRNYRFAIVTVQLRRERPAAVFLSYIPLLNDNFCMDAFGASCIGNILNIYVEKLSKEIAKYLEPSLIRLAEENFDLLDLVNRLRERYRTVRS